MVQHKKIYHLGRSSQVHLKGRGMGSVLLVRGGPGVGSSYGSLEEYHKITGTGMETKLLNLPVKQIVRKAKNIHF